jgi:hypothetical protein
LDWDDKVTLLLQKPLRSRTNDSRLSGRSEWPLYHSGLALNN